MSAQPKAPKAPKAQTANGGSLKRLQPAVDLAERSSSAGQQVYEAVKAKLPTAAVERVEKLESAAAGAAAPLIHKAQDTGATLLQAADSRVDAAASRVTASYERNAAFLADQVARQKEIHAQNVETYKAAREAYLKKVEDAVEYVKQRGVTGAARDAADEVLARVGEAQAAAGRAAGSLVHKVQEAVERLLAFGPVSTAVEAAKPALGAAQATYMTVHDRVVGTGPYRQAHALAEALALRAQQTWLFGAVQQRLPQAAVDTATPYFNSLVQHLQPISA